MKHIGKLGGVILALILMTLTFHQLLTSLTPSYTLLEAFRRQMYGLTPSLNLPSLLWSYRWFDVVFLTLAVFATIAGLATLFGAEPKEVTPEEPVLEGFKEEVMEEE